MKRSRQDEKVIVKENVEELEVKEDIILYYVIYR